MGANVWFCAINFLLTWKVRNVSHTGRLKNHANIVNKIHRTVDYFALSFLITRSHALMASTSYLWRRTIAIFALIFSYISVNSILHRCQCISGVCVILLSTPRATVLATVLLSVKHRKLVGLHILIIYISNSLWTLIIEMAWLPNYNIRDSITEERLHECEEGVCTLLLLPAYIVV